MKTKEFIKRVGDLGYFINKYVDYYEIKDESDNLIAVTNKTMFLQLNTDYCQWDELCEIDKKELFDLLVEYARTPIEDREEEKKFYLKHKYIRSAGGGVEYFTIWISQKFPFLKYKNFSDEFKQQFTLKEIEEIKEKFDTDLNDFELVEVKE